MQVPTREGFWSLVFALRGAVTTRIILRVAFFGALSQACLMVHPYFPQLALDVGPVELAGGVLATLLVMRSNAGYDRWYEGRKLWGAIVNDTRAMATGGLAYGPEAPHWRRQWTRTCCAFAHTTRARLRGEGLPTAASALLGDSAAEVARSVHPPSAVTLQIAKLLHQAGDHINPAAGINLEAARMRLIAHVGACERIVATPLPRMYVISLRRFVALYLVLVPLALVDKVGWATPMLTMLVSYAALGMDQIAAELENPFDTNHLDHLPLDDICTRLQREWATELAEAQVLTQDA